MKKNIHIFQAGFTLIELLVVIAIIGILVAISFFGAQNVFQSSRDTQRKSDLKQYQNALENYANKNNGFYVAGSAIDASITLCGYLSLTNCPEDPLYDPSGGDVDTPVYLYQSDGGTEGTATATKYVLWATLEDQTQGIIAWVVCSNGKVGPVKTYSSGSDCPL